MLPKVFIASSSEGLSVAETVRGLLLHEHKLEGKAKVRLWTREFELSDTYIESLEKATQEMDFAVVVLTPDDVTTSREAEKPAPRDNVVFELGLFIGSLGRERCFLVHEEIPELKLPSDLLGVKTATFKRPLNGKLKTALDASCSLMRKRITKLSSRYKLSRDELADYTAIRKFVSQVEGAWWDRVITKDVVAISFFEIIPEIVTNTVQMVRGKAFNLDGGLIATWDSVATRILKDENRIDYSWKGDRPVTHPETPFMGVGEMVFYEGYEDADIFSRGKGRFSDLPMIGDSESTQWKHIELKRTTKRSDIQTMQDGNDQEKSLLVRTILSKW